MKTDEFEKHYYISKGMIHLAYRADGPEDVICHYSPEGYEVLNSEFLSFIEYVQPHLPGGLPVVLEIFGSEISTEDQERISRAVSGHFYLHLTAVRHNNRNTYIRMLWFLISFLLSAYLLFAVDNNTTANVIVQYAYLPFWFFGYRLLIFLIIDLPGLLKEARRCEQLVQTRVFFSGSSYQDEIPEEMVEECWESIGKAEHYTYSDVVRHYMLDGDGNTCMLINAKDYNAIICGSSAEGYETLTDELRTYIDQQLPYIPDPARVRISFRGDLSEEEKKKIAGAVQTYLAYTYEDAKNTFRTCLSKVIRFCILMAVATILLILEDTMHDKAVMEFITMMFWFFGDFLIEYILLDLSHSIIDFSRARKLMGTKVQFEDLNIKNK